MTTYHFLLRTCNAIIAPSTCIILQKDSEDNGAKVVTYSVFCSKPDLGKLIGRKGNNAQCIRTLARCIEMCQCQNKILIEFNEHPTLCPASPDSFDTT